MKIFNIKNIAKMVLLVAFPLVTVTGSLTSCQDKDYESFPTAVKPIDKADVHGRLNGDRYEITWSELGDGLKMQVTRYIGKTVDEVSIVDDNMYIHDQVDTNIEYTYVLKVMKETELPNKDKRQEYSTGVVLSYTREGATRISGLAMSQVDKVDGYDVKIEWNPCADATKVVVWASNLTTGETIKDTIDGKRTSYMIPNVVIDNEWSVTAVALNEKGASLPSFTSLKIGKTQIGFLSVYPTEEELIANGDDDEASAWLWTKSEYPTAKYVYFGDIKSKADIDSYRVLFWLRDLEGVGEDAVFNMPEVVKAATPAIREWYTAGGNLLLWSHAMPYVETIGRVPAGTIQSNDRAIGTGVGGWNPDTWAMAVSAYPGHSVKIDFSDHPIYRGFDIIENNDCKLIQFKGPGWTEDHNCLFFNWPGQLTGKSNEDRACYDHVTNRFGIYPLGTWDSQIWWIGQLNVWEAQQGDTEFKGTILCIGNGGCEFSMKNEDGTPDKSAYPKNNIYQDNVLRLAKNSLEYLKTR